MEHEIKSNTQNFARLKSGIKTFDFIHDENSYQSGDIIKIREWNEEGVNSTTSTPKGYTDSPPLIFKIGFIQHDGHKVILSYLPHKQEKQTKTSKKK